VGELTHDGLGLELDGAALVRELVDLPPHEGEGALLVVGKPE